MTKIAATRTGVFTAVPQFGIVPVGADRFAAGQQAYGISGSWRRGTGCTSVLGVTTTPAVTSKRNDSKRNDVAGPVAHALPQLAPMSPVSVKRHMVNTNGTKGYPSWRCPV
jgi:hypothetical protein